MYMLKLDRVFLLAEDPPQWNFTAREIQTTWDPPPHIAMTLKQIFKNGCLTNHLKNVHNVHDLLVDKEFLDSTTYSELDRDEIILRTVGQAMTSEEFIQDIPDTQEEFDAAHVDASPNKVPESTNLQDAASMTSPPQAVPLCPMADNYIVQKGKTLPASFLTTLLPAKGFLEELNKILHDKDNIENLLERFDQEICCFMCEVCDFTFSGKKNLQIHKSNNHQESVQLSRPHPAFPYLGDYLASLERKIDQCTQQISKQSEISTQQTVMIKKLLTLNEVESVDKDQDVVLFYKCPCCKFETENANILRSHKKEKHSDYQETHSWEEPHICDECGVEFNSEKKFKSHKDEVHNNISNLISCPLCSYTHNEESNVTKHVADNHKESNSPDINCPICEFKSSSEDIVTKHIEYQHPEKQKCVICPESFSTKVDLNNHTTNVHLVSQDKNKQLNKYQCKNCPENLFGLPKKSYERNPYQM